MFLGEICKLPGNQYVMIYADILPIWKNSNKKRYN